MVLGRGMGDEDICVGGNGAGPSVSVGGVCEGMLGAEGNDCWDLRGAVDREGPDICICTCL